MNVIIDDYEPMGNQVLLKLEIKGTTESGIIMNKKQADKWMTVVKVGALKFSRQLCFAHTDFTVANQA